MKLKTRLVISFLIILTVPFMLAGLAYLGLNFIQQAQGEQFLVDSSYARIDNSLNLLVQYANQHQEEVDEWVQADYDRAATVSELEKFNQKLHGDGATYLVVRQDEELIFDGSSGKVPINMEELPAYGTNSSDTNVVLVLNAGQPALLRQFDFITTDWKFTTVFMVVTSDQILPETQKKILDVFASVFLILVLTAAILIGWTYRGIVPRLRKLIHAADEIKEGNLETPITDSGVDEISDLFRSFEDMRKRLQANAKEKMRNEEEQRQLISNIAHDLKTPITAVKGYAEGILDGIANTPEKEERYLRTIYSKANEMNTLINELSLYTKIDTNRIPYNFQRLNVRNYFLDCAEELGIDLGLQEVQFNFYNFVEDNVEIIADPEQLERVIHNIVGNSVKYRGEEKLVIKLRIKDVGDFIQVEIEDNGKGISSTDLPHIFERMFRADASRNSGIGGSGIGLSIVKKIVEDHGGSIWATSKERVGTVMYFVIRKYEEVQNG